MTEWWFFINKENWKTMF